MDQQKEDPGKLETWAIVEVMGHNRFAGYVQQVPMGGAAMIRIDVPEIAEEEIEEVIGWAEDDTAPNGRRTTQTRKRRVPGTPAFTKFLGVSSIFAITPCSKEVAIAAVKSFKSAPVTILHMPPPRQLEHRYSDDDF
jgi:hypothetical protein